MLVLDSGAAFSVHSLYLLHISPVFSNALACTSGTPAAHDDSPRQRQGPAAKRAKQALRLPLPGTSRKQALLLLHCMYAFDRSAWASTLDPPELVEVARIADRFDCAKVLQLVDNALVQACKVPERPVAGAARMWTTAEQAPAQYQLARQLHLPQLELHCGRFLGLHAHKVDLAEVRGFDAGLAAALEAALELRIQAFEAALRKPSA